MNIIKADVYRLIRGKGIYITFGILVAMVALIVFSSAEVTMGVNMAEVEDSLGHTKDASVAYNGKNIAAILYRNMDAMAYFLLPLIIFVAAPMFTYGAVKNGLSYGISRTKLYFSKLILSSVLCAILVLVYIFSGVLLATILRGFGGPVTVEYWFGLLKVCGSQLFMMLALNCIGLFLVFTTKRTAMVNGIYIAFTMVPLLLISILYNFNEKFIDLYEYDIIGNIKSLAYIDAMSNVDVTKSLMIGISYIVVSTVMGIFIFNKSEIK